MLGRYGVFSETGRKQEGTTVVPLLSEIRAKTTEAPKYREEGRAAVRWCVRGPGKHLKRAFAPLFSAEF